MRKSSIALVTLALFTLALAAAAGEPAAPPAEAGQPEVLAEFSVEKGGRPILLPVRIGEQKHLFMLDTGAAATFIDESFKPALGQPSGKRKTHTPGGDLELDVFEAPDAPVGKLNLKDGGPVACSDFEMIRRVTRRNIRGVLGMSFLAGHVVRIDFDEGKVQFLRPDGKEHPEWGAAVELKPHKLKGILVAEVAVTGAGNVECVVDTGANVTLGLAEEEFDKALEKSARAEAFYETTAGTIRSTSGRLDKLVLAGDELPGVIADRGRWNVLGLGLLSRYVVTLDFPNKKMYLRKGKAFDRRDEVDMSGLHILLLDRKITVHSLDKASPAEAAGIRAGDIIAKVGEKDATDIDLLDLRDLLKSGDGKEITLTIKRGEDEKTFTFKLKRRI